VDKPNGLSSSYCTSLLMYIEEWAIITAVEIHKCSAHLLKVGVPTVVLQMPLLWPEQWLDLKAMENENQDYQEVNTAVLKNGKQLPEQYTE
jgi:hypothetical protein